MRPNQYQEKPRRLWILWVLLGLLLVMATGLAGMIYMEQQVPEVAVPTAAPTLPPSPPTPAPTPELETPPPTQEPTEEPSAEEESSLVEAEPEVSPEPPEESPALNEESEGLEIAEDPLWYLRLVNRDHPLPESYELNLVEVPGGQMVDERIYEPLMELLNAATAENLGPIVVAGYRTWEKQQSLMDAKIAEYLAQGYSEEDAVALAERWVSIPGHSEHQLGIAVDINGSIYEIYAWLAAHSWEYGFIQRYPAGKTDITGCQEEPWHYRYVGVEAAAAIYESGLCLEEYLAYIGQ